MKNKVVVSVALLIGVQILLVFGPPFELKETNLYRVTSASYCLVVLAMMVFQYLKVKQLSYRKTRLAFRLLIIFYFMLFILSNISDFKFGSRWKDTHVYQNSRGVKVASQFVEYSGSYYDYRDRLLIHEFSNGNRISISWFIKLMHGPWKVYDVEKDSTYFKNFDLH